MGVRDGLAIVLITCYMVRMLFIGHFYSLKLKRHRLVTQSDAAAVHRSLSALLFGIDTVPQLFAGFSDHFTHYWRLIRTESLCLNITLAGRSLYTLSLSIGNERGLQTIP